MRPDELAALEARVARLERTTGHEVLKRALETTWLPEGDTFLLPKSVGADSIEDASITDTLLASPNNSVWRLLHEGWIVWGTGGSNTYLIGDNTANVSGTSGTGGNKLLHIDPATDMAVAGKTTQFRIKVVWQTNSTAPTVSWVFSIRAVTAAGGTAGNTSTTVSGSDTGNTATVTTPAANSYGQVTGTAFTAPAADTYSIVAVPSGTPAANSREVFHIRLEMRHN